VNAELSKGLAGVECSYVRAGKALRVRARHAVLASYNMMVPYLCPEISKKQKEALQYAVKMPLVYVNVLIRNWRAFEKLGIYQIIYPNGFYHSATLDFPVSLGKYNYPKNPKEPMILHLTHVPTFPGQGLDARSQHRMGQHALFSTSFETYERHAREQLGDALGSAGFDPKRDILAITVNRWPHGYTYEYNELFDPDWDEGSAPHEIGRQRIGRIAIANADAGASAYADTAIDQADRAVGELLGS